VSSRWNSLAEGTRTEDAEEVRDRLRNAGLRGELNRPDGEDDKWLVNVPANQHDRAHRVIRGSSAEETLLPMPEPDGSRGSSLRSHVSRFLVPLAVVIGYVFLAIVLVAGFGWWFG
jgi:hypothetical protein